MRSPMRVRAKPFTGLRWMIYELAFLDEALKEWRRLDNVTRDQFKTKLAERLQNPKIPSARLNGAKERYKIKLRNAGFRLVYEVRDKELLVLVVAVGKRERNAVYKAAANRSAG
jgi:mRNA interferase RelE/StbE